MKKDEKVKTRANWFAIQEEERRQQEEFEEMQRKIKNDIAFDNARSNIVINKVQRTIAEQEIKLHQLKMSFPHKLPDEPFSRDLQNLLNDRQKKKTTGLKKDLEEERKLAKELSNQKQKTMRRRTTTKALGKQVSIMQKESSRHLSILNSPITSSSKNISMMDNSPSVNLKIPVQKEESSFLLSPILQEESSFTSRKSNFGSRLSIKKIDTHCIAEEKSQMEESKDRMMANIEAKKQFKPPTP